jgi:hypothetical protein
MNMVGRLHQKRLTSMFCSQVWGTYSCVVLDERRFNTEGKDGADRRRRGKHSTISFELVRGKKSHCHNAANIFLIVV